MIRSGLAGLLAIGAAFPAVADDVPVGLQPYQIVRSLERVQDRLAGGDHASQPMQRRLLEMIDARFATREGSRFENELNRRALLVYAMSGGNPHGRGRARPPRRDDPSRKLGEHPLLRQRQPKQAIDAFATVDPMAYWQTSMYRLVKGSILTETEPAQALARSTRPASLPARLSRPRSSVSVAVAARLGDAERFLRLSDNMSAPICARPTPASSPTPSSPA